MPESVAPELCRSFDRSHQFCPPGGASECLHDAASEDGRQGTTTRRTADSQAPVRVASTAAPPAGSSQR